MAGISTLRTTASRLDDHDEATRSSLLADCLAHRDKMMKWYSQRKKALGGAPTSCLPGQSLHTRLRPAEGLFGLPYAFSSIDNARYHVLFWAALSILQNIIGRAQSHPILCPDAREEYLLSEFYADEMCRAMPWLLQSTFNAWGAHGTLFGVAQIGIVYLEFNQLDKFLWAQHALCMMGEDGSDFAYRLHDYFAYRWKLLNGGGWNFASVSS
ncbi:hypothetical protein N7492_009588 [Penicillium capsulatum]|uniref:Uncharacterized protein n=1 Tax=Penicillium capsulatum TaxID=69766 RepID=A0A9W9HUZ1_9EURO|nr:hypothetical protein N7492_009588 [Penicillium capsulatum]KAJ6106976.1 hypothetical protein N7512_010493 [Penicillium capsulatum]